MVLFSPRFLPSLTILWLFPRWVFLLLLCLFLKSWCSTGFCSLLTSSAHCLSHLMLFSGRLLWANDRNSDLRAKDNKSQFSSPALCPELQTQPLKCFFTYTPLDVYSHLLFSTDQLQCDTFSPKILHLQIHSPFVPRNTIDNNMFEDDTSAI